MFDEKIREEAERRVRVVERQELGEVRNALLMFDGDGVESELEKQQARIRPRRVERECQSIMQALLNAAHENLEAPRATPRERTKVGPSRGYIPKRHW